MTRGDDPRLWIVTGALGGLVLGIALIPLRSVTSASNLAFAFVAFTIVIAELGGRSAALVTAVVSTLALNFFLTEPYLSLRIERADDLIAFGALAACGLIAAAFGRRRERMSTLAADAGNELEILGNLGVRLRAGAPLDEMLALLPEGFGFRAIALRDGDQRTVAAAPAGDIPVSRPETDLAPDTLLPSDAMRLRSGPRGLRLPDGGGRLPIAVGGRTMALELWEGDPQGFGVNEVRALAIAATLIGLELARRAAADAAA